ncbi:GpE family phage tail protein [Chelatococcus caeni]
MADVAVILHWSPAELENRGIDEIRAWHGRALRRFEALAKAGLR